MNELAIINPTQFGIEETKAKELYGNLPQILSERSVLEQQFDDVIKQDIENPETWKQARELRLLIQKNRTKGIEIWHKNAKDYFLKGGQFVDAIKRKEVDINKKMELDLEEIEKHKQIQEQKKLAELQNQRVKELIPYVENAAELDLSSMECDVWEAYYQVKKKAFEDEQKRIEDERKTEELKQAKLKLHNDRKNSILDLWQFVPEELKEADFSDFENFIGFVDDLKGKKELYEKEQEAIRKENERLQKEREEAEEKAEAERKERERLAKIEAEKQRKLEAERKAKEEKEKAEYEVKLRAEREEKERIQKELESKAEAERKAKEEYEVKLQAELNKGDSEKVKDLINDLNSIKDKYSFRSKKNQKMYMDVKYLIDKVITHIQK